MRYRRYRWYFLLLLGLITIASKVPYRIMRPRVAYLLQKLPCSSKVLGPPKGVVSEKEIIMVKRSIAPEEIVLGKEFPLTGVCEYGAKPCLDKICEIPSAPAYLLRLEHARIYGKKGFVITQEDALLCCNAHDVYKFRKIMHKIKFPRAVPQHEVGVLITSQSYWNYFHWVTQLLPKFLLVQDAQLTFDHIYLSDKATAFQQDSLQALGVDHSKIHILRHDDHLELDQLWIPICERGEPSCGSGLSLHWTIPRLRKAFLTQNYPQTKRLYVTRKQTSSRHLINDDAVFAFLQPFGFERVFMEEYSFLEQIALFAQAEAIIALHGAGLTNLIFCAPHTLVLELMHPEWVNGCFWEIAMYNQLDYYVSLICPEKTKSRSKKDRYLGSLPTESLREYLSALALR